MTARPPITFRPNTHFAAETTVLERLGLVAFWTGRAIAWMLWAVAAYLWWDSEPGFRDAWVGPTIIAVVGLFSWLAGRGLLFILAAR